MYLGINLSGLDKLDLESELSGIEEEFENWKKLKASQSKVFRKDIENFINKDGCLDGGLIKKNWFPEAKGNHLFISHAHTDEEIALCLAFILDKFLKIKCFIDSQVWGFADDLLKDIDKKYAYQENTKTYDYSIRNKTTSNINLILNSSLQSTIDDCELFVFINTNNSTIDQKLDDKLESETYSPWLMSEIQFSRIVRKRLNRKTNVQKALNYSSESRDSSDFMITHDIKLDHLHSFDVEEFFEALIEGENRGNAEDFLNSLYGKIVERIG